MLLLVPSFLTANNLPLSNLGILFKLKSPAPEIKRYLQVNSNLAKEYFVDKAINEAAFVLERIDKRWSVGG